MKLTQIIKLSLTSILTKKTRTILTVSGITISVAITLFMMGIGNGIQNIITGELNRSELANVITVSTKKVKTLKIDQPIVSKMKSLNGVSKVEEIANLSGNLTYHGTSVGMPIYAVSKDYFDVTPVSFSYGKGFRTDKTELPQVLVNNSMLKALSVTAPQNVIDKEVSLDLLITNDLAPEQAESSKNFVGNKYQIVGIIDKGETPLAYIPLEGIFKLGVKYSSQAKIMVSYPDKINSVREFVEQLGFQTTNIKDTISQVNRIFSVLRLLLVIFGTVTLLVATLGILNTITISLVEQTREIGFLRLIGIKERDVKFLFISESILLSFSGTLFGVILGYIIMVIANAWIFLIAKASNVYAPNIVQIPLLMTVIILISAFLLGWVIGLYPAKRAVKIDPLVALRF